ncbi:MAG: hypothetical protein A4E42_00261 [Methanoregulaceae archaeon PtaU1.Bin222]|nr:MAG: hypothetical protein A4E42_00261 [Methanoregulaceae archaeon PtaU1.Bin222]
MWAGFWRVEVVPSPKFQDHAVGFSVTIVDEVSVNWTLSGFGHWDMKVKFATGGQVIQLMHRIFEIELDPPALETVRVISYPPTAA